MALLPQQDTIDQYVADGAEINFDYKYLLPTEADLAVYVTPPNQQANENADLVSPNAYTISNVGNLAGGTVTFLSPPAGASTVTLVRVVRASINTNYAAAQTINGINLDGSFQREMLVIQQNQTNFDDVGLRYQINSFLPDTSNRNILPTLQSGFIWIGSASGGIAAAELDENPTCSTLRSELAQETQGSDGAGLVGYYDESRALGTTVRDQLNEYGSRAQGADGASLIGYYDPIAMVETTVAARLDIGTSDGFRTGDYKSSSAPVGQSGWAYCNGDSFDMVGDFTTGEIQNLGNFFNDNNVVIAYGIGVDSYATTKPMADTIDHECSQVGVAVPPDPHTSGFTIVVTQIGTVSVKQIVQVTTLAGNAISPGAYYEIKAPSGRSSVFWFEVDTVGSAPSFPGSLIQKVPILSTDTADQVAQAILDNSFLQYRVPDGRGMGSRGWNDGSSEDPDAALRTDIQGTVIGDIVGSRQQHALQDHTHFFEKDTSYQGGGSLAGAQPAQSLQWDIPTLGVSPTANVGSDTRGSNISKYTLIKF